MNIVQQLSLWQKNLFLNSNFTKKAYILVYLGNYNRGELMHYEEEEEWDDEEDQDYWRDDE